VAHEQSISDKQRLLDHLLSYATPRKRERMQEVIANRTRYITVVMEDIFQPHNANATVRTCEILGVQDVHVVQKSNQFSVVNTVAMGACKWLNVHPYQTSEQAIDKLKNDGYRIVATVPSPTAKTLADLPLDTGKLALFFGTEETGLTSQILASADEFLQIPMYGFTQSYNVSVSVAICLQALISRLRDTHIDWRLTDEQKLDVLLEWAYKAVPAAQYLEKELEL